MPETGNPQKRRTWIRVGIAALVILSAFAVAAAALIRRATPLLKKRIEETLSARFESRVELAGLQVFFFRGLEVSGTDLRIFPARDLAAANTSHPLISIQSFAFHSGIVGLFLQPMRVRQVHVTGMQINIPPREMRAESLTQHQNRKNGTHIVVEEIICDQSRLTIETAKPDKDPKQFELRHIVLEDAGSSAPWKYDAILVNPLPKGDIHAAGSFGPWQNQNAGDSPVTGHYNFDHADLNTIKGIGGILSSVGDFTGQLNRIVINGTTETPDFSLDTAKHAVPLHTSFHAVVDGTSGDTYLQEVKAKLRNSSFVTSGSVVNIKGQGHRVDLDVDVADAALQDFLELAIKTKPVVMTGRITTKAKLQIRPGQESVPDKLGMNGNFTLGSIHFVNPQVQDKVDMLSLRAQGEPKSAKPGAEDVQSSMKGTFEMSDGVLRFQNLFYVLPGAEVNLDGVYSLDGQKFDFHGKVRTDASLSHMVDSPWKSLLLKVVSPFFKRKGGGAEIPVSISGTKSEPKFGLDVMGHGGK